MQTDEKERVMGGTGVTATRAEEAQSGQIQLWLVDDNERLSETLAELLADFRGVKCTGRFSSASAALSALASRMGPDVILLDIQMKGENGLDAIRPIRSLSRSTRVIMLTTFYDSNMHSRAMEDGASAFLLKRYAMEEIVDSIRRANAEPVSLRSPRRSCSKATCAPQEVVNPGEPRQEVNCAQSAEAPSTRRRSALLEQWFGLFRSRN